MKKILVTFTLFSVALAGCQTGGIFSAQSVGGVGGAALGAFAGNKIGAGKGKLLATAGGAVLGGALGASIGSKLDQRDHGRAQQAQTFALQQPAGAPVQWHNPQTGGSGQVVSGAGYTINDRECRDYTHSFFVNGAQETVRGVACRQPDGSWQAVS